MDGQVNLLVFWRADPFAAFRRLRSRLDRVARFATQNVGLALLYRDVGNHPRRSPDQAAKDTAASRAATSTAEYPGYRRD